MDDEIDDLFEEEFNRAVTEQKSKQEERNELDLLIAEEIGQMEGKGRDNAQVQNKPTT